MFDVFNGCEPFTYTAHTNSMNFSFTGEIARWLAYKYRINKLQQQ